MLKKITDHKDLRGKKVLLRLDLNVPIQDGRVTDDYRIKKSLPMIEFLRNAGARTIILAHIETEENPTLQPVFEHLSQKFPVSFVQDFTQPGTQQVFSAMKEGDVVLHENIRQYPGEKKNDPAFAAQLAALGELYVNDAFSACHRSHASIVGIPAVLPGYAGIQLIEEIENLSKAFKPPHPFVFVLGGAKFSTKLPVIERFMALADTVFVGGALANDLFKELGYEVGVSLVSSEPVSLKSVAESPKVMIPVDVTVTNAGIASVKKADQVSRGDKIVDVASESLAQLRAVISTAKFVLWNGPLGQYEEGFTEPTHELARMIAESGAESIVGGGDTLAAIAQLGLDEKFTFISTGGGAMLDFLAEGTLTGIAALEKSAS